MSDPDNLKQTHSWRSKFRSRHHDAAHEQAPEGPVDVGGREDVPRGKAAIVDRQEELVALIGRLRVAGSFAYDSEFIGELSYVPKLCVLQIATTSEIALVDPLAEALDLTPLWELLADASVEKIVHAGSQDMEPVLRYLGRPAANVVDTQIAAGFAGLPYPLSLQRLVLQVLGLRLGKGLTFTHWDQRPLSAQQARYAADDVRFLPAGWRDLKASIERAGTLAWVRQECDQMCISSPYTFDPETSFMKTRGAGTLDRRQLGVLRELAIWRDGSAKEADLPPRTFLKDEILIEMCRRPPTTEEKLGNIQGLPRPVRNGQGEAIVKAVQRGMERPVEAGGEFRKNEELPRQQFQADAIHALAQSLCMAKGIDPQLVLTRGDTGELLQRIRRGKGLEGLRIMQGWRRDVIGNTLAELCRQGGAVNVAVMKAEG